MLILVSALACCSSKREVAVFVSGGRTLPSGYHYFIFYLPAIPLHCKDILKKPSAWGFVSVSRGVSVPLFSRPLESSNRLQGGQK